MHWNRVAGHQAHLPEQAAPVLLQECEGDCLRSYGPIQLPLNLGAMALHQIVHATIHCIFRPSPADRPPTFTGVLVNGGAVAVLERLDLCLMVMLFVGTTKNSSTIC